MLLKPHYAPEAALPSCNYFCISKRLFCCSIRFPPKRTTLSLSLSLSLTHTHTHSLHHYQHAYSMTAECEFPRGPFHFVSLAFALTLDLSPLPGIPFLLQKLLSLQAILAREVFVGALLGEFLRSEHSSVHCALYLIYCKGANQLHAQHSMDESHEIGVQDRRPVHLPGNDSGKWSSSPEPGHKIEIGKQIFCNRSLNMKNIVAVGFDIDYTLAQYKPETFESLAYQGTIKKLVFDLGYPRELLKWSFDWKYMVRGLVLDKKRGNILKMDRHKYVKVAYHGFKALSKEDKVGTYGNTLVSNSFDEPDYALIDTLFSLAEAYLFAQLVDFKDSHPGKISEHVDYARMYKDVRAAVDMCHRDGTLKQMVAKDPKRYINDDPSIVPILKMIRASGRATFLVTNSLWDYTNTVMDFLCGSSVVDGSTNFGWLQYFDVVITGSAKPSFFHEENRANLFEVKLETGMLINTDNGSPMPQVDYILARLLPEDKGVHKVFQGGSVGHLHKLLSVASSSQVLYVGDHIYGDILRSKKVLGWRTMLVVPELEKEVKLLWESRNTRKELQFLRSERDRIEDEIHRMKWSLKSKNPKDDVDPKLSSELEKLEFEREKVRSNHQETQRKLHQRFHKVWGQLMKTGYQNSRFAHQVERFACLYTSQVSNLGLYSPDKYYRTSEDFMPHEFNIVAYEPRETEV